MIVPTLNIDVMTFCSFVVFLFLSFAWNRTDTMNFVMKMIFIVMTIWTGMNTIALFFWFQGM